MLSFLKQSIDQQSSNAAKVRWSETNAIHTYEGDSVVNNAKPFKPRSSRREFKDVSKGIYLCRIKTLQELRKQYKQLLPELKRLDLWTKSIEELEAVESKMINDLDNLGKKDPETGDFNTSQSLAYRAIENNLLVVIEALKCRRQQVDFLADSTSHLQTELDPSRITTSEYEFQKVGCFSFVFRNSLGNEIISDNSPNQRNKRFDS